VLAVLVVQMNKLIGAIIAMILIFTMLSTVSYWKHNASLSEVFTLFLSLIILIGTITLGVAITEWLENNDTTNGEKQ